MNFPAKFGLLGFCLQQIDTHLSHCNALLSLPQTCANPDFPRAESSNKLFIPPELLTFTSAISQYGYRNLGPNTIPDNDRESPCTNLSDGALSIAEGIVYRDRSGLLGLMDSFANKDIVPTWRKAAIILNSSEKKYTIGSGDNSENIFNLESLEEFLIFKDKSDMSKWQCKMECDINGGFWLGNLGNGEIFLNGELVEDFPVRLLFGDIFYFSTFFSNLWDPNITRKAIVELYRKSKYFALFKFEKKVPSIEMQSRTSISSDLQSFTLNYAIFENSVILSNIFDYFSNNPQDLFNFRLVSHAWNLEASLILRKTVQPTLFIVADEIITNPNETLNSLHVMSHRINALQFHSLKVIIVPERNNVFTTTPKQNEARDAVMIKFYLDFSGFLSQDIFRSIKRIDVNSDYLIPIILLFSKFQFSLEELEIQINSLWVSDQEEEFPSFPNKLTKLRKLTLDFCVAETDEVSKISESGSFNKLLKACCGIEYLVLKNYVKLPIGFETYVRLRKVIGYGKCYVGVRDLQLADCLSQLNSIQIGQVTVFRLMMDQMWVEGRSLLVEKELFSFLQRQHGSLETLELSMKSLAFRQRIKIPRCMPALRKVWICHDAFSKGHNKDFLWGMAMQDQITGEVDGFLVPKTFVPLVRLDDGKCCHKWCSCHGVKGLCLAFGGRVVATGEFVAYGTNV